MKRILLLSIIALMTHSGWSQCNANFTDTVIGNTVYYTNTSTGYNVNNTFFTWIFQGGNPTFSYNSDTVSVTYNSAGTYSACLVLSDSGSCTDSICYNVTIGQLPPTINISNTNSVCGMCNGTATVNVTQSTSLLDYWWSTGDSTLGTSATSNTITGLCPGTYSVTVYDSVGSSVETVTVLGVGGVSVNITSNDSSPCLGDSTVLLTANATGSGGYSYSWSNGSTNQAIYPNGSGLYVVTVTDSNLCTGVDSFNISYNTISASLSTINETCAACCDGSVSATASSGSGNYTYAWSNSSTTSSISSLCPGTYTVTVTDANTGCQTIQSTTVSAFTCANISGIIAQGYNAKVYLIEEIGGFLTALDSVLTDSMGGYAFNNICAGTYYLKGALLPAHSSFTSYIPTYFDSASLWSNSTAVIMGSSNQTVNFSLLFGINSGGPGFIGGLVSQGANRAEGDPVANVQVVLLDENGNVSAFTKTDANGEYSLSNLAYGTYKVHIDMLNKTSYPIEVTLDENNQELNSGDFLVFNEYIKPTVPNGVSDLKFEQAELYPNPSTALLNIASASNISKVEVFNLIGVQVLQQQANSKNQTTIDLSQLAKGTYMVAIETINGVEHHKVIKE